MKDKLKTIGRILIAPFVLVFTLIAVVAMLVVELFTGEKVEDYDPNEMVAKEKKRREEEKRIRKDGDKKMY